MIDEQTINDLKAKHPGPLEYLKIAGHEFVVKAADENEWEQFQDLIHDEKRRSKAMTALARNCVVFPDRASFSAILSKKPALALKLAESVVELSGAADATEKKAL